ncbi:MAG: 1-deoxy-D-xylulose-5-phosphate synthase, partial [Acetatifactor sp.]|nr:1-deoxy-D-xylulose-5-phosphate synthase [Acetatifactor sp.]
ENVVGVSNYLNNIRTSDSYLDLKKSIYDALRGTPRGKNMVTGIRRVKSSFKQLVIPGMFFEDMGITYLGPVDGHNIRALVRVIQEARRVNGAVLIHAITQKGKGYAPAERHPARFHGAEPFDVETGLPTNRHTAPSYTDVFSTVMCKLGGRDEKVVAITAAMPDGTGLKRFRNMYPERFFDVGIAEEHAVTFAAGLAAGGMKPVVAIYSSFLQRAYDQILHDVCIQKMPVVFAIDRAGLVGSDGETHQGIFDFSYLSSIPNMHVCAPKNKWELADMLKYAVQFGGPIAIRYPRGEAYDGLKEYREPVVCGRAEWICREREIALFAVGSMVKTAEQVREKLKACGKQVSLVNARFVKPIDRDAVREACKDHGMIVTMEENVSSGGYGEKVLQCINDENMAVDYLRVALPDAYIEHGNVEKLKGEIGMDADSICRKILEKCQCREK